MQDERIFSCDDHIDLWALPPDLWQARMPAALQAGAPRVVEAGAMKLWKAGDKILGPSGLTMAQYSAIARAGIADDGLRASTPDLRLADMDRDGIYSSVIYGPSLLGLQIDDLELKAACLRAYNDWAAEFNALARERLCVLPVLPTHDARRRGRGARARREARPPRRDPLLLRDPRHRPAWEALWQAAAHHELPISFHIGGGGSLIELDAHELEARRLGRGDADADGRAARGDDLLGCARAQSEDAPGARRGRHRLGAVHRRAHGLGGREARRVGEGLPHQAEAERDLPPARCW